MNWGMLRVKNEARWIEPVVPSIQPVTDVILFFGDHSTDGTPNICESLECRVFRSGLEDIAEARDKDFLLTEAWELGAEIGDYCLMVDGDEALEPPGIQAVRHARASLLNCCFHIVYLRDREDQVRTDWWYKEFWRASLFRLTARDLTFRRTRRGGNLHWSAAPAQLRYEVIPIPARLLHYGCLHHEDRIRKYRRYTAIDPINMLEECYRHMVVGDVFPAGSVFQWVGPLQLEALQ